MKYTQERMKYNKLEQYIVQHCKENPSDIKQIYEALNLLIDKTKPSKIRFKTDS